MTTAEHRANARNFLKKATDYLDSAEDNLAMERPTPAAGGGSDSGPSRVATDAADKKQADGSDKGDADKFGSESNPAKVGETLKLKGTQYTVKSAKTSPTIGDELLNQRANGVYVIVELTIENKKNETKTFSDQAAKLNTSNGKKYSTDTDGSISSENPLIFEDMQPDVPKSGLLVFDVPAGSTKGSVLEVSDLFGGGEAYIALGLR